MHVAYCFVHTQTMFRLRCHWGNIHHCVGGIHFEPLKTRLQLASMRLFKPSNSLKQLIGIDLIQDMSPSAIQKANTVIFLQVPIFLMKLPRKHWNGSCWFHIGRIPNLLCGTYICSPTLYGCGGYWVRSIPNSSKVFIWDSFSNFLIMDISARLLNHAKK